MKQLALHTNISLEQLYSLLAQLSDQEKLTISNKLRAEVAGQKWRTLSEAIPEESAISEQDIISEVKLVRRSVSNPDQAL